MAKTLEDDFQELEDIIAKMEEEGVPLEESFKLYEKGLSEPEGIELRRNF